MKALFTTGLILQIIGQISFSLHPEIINLMEPLDFIHWSILIGIVLITPYTLNFSQGIYYKIGAIISLMGITCFIGMCGVDFVLWAFKDDVTTRNLIIEKLIKEPSIWSPFMTVGPALLFIGLSIQSLYYLRDNQWSVILVIIGASMAGIGELILTEYRIVFLFGYSVFAIGLLLIAYGKKKELQQRV